MKSLTREAILRMTGTEPGSGIGTPVTGGGGNTAGLASESWVDENYIGKDFFNEIFEIQGKKTTTIGSGTPVKVDYVFEPNELPETKTTTEGGVTTTVKTEITKIKIKAGAYTDSFLSALGLGTGGGSGSTSALYNLIDVKPNAGGTMVYGLDGTLADNGKVLTYNATYSKWVAQTIQQSGGVIQSVTLTTPANSGLLVALGSGTPGNTATISTASGTFALSLATGYEMFKPLDYFDASKNAKKANALNVAEAKKVWGQTYLNASGVPQDVTGNMTNVGDISFDTNGTRNIGSISNSALAIYAGFGYFFSNAPAVHVGNDNTHFIALHWSAFVDNVNSRGLYDYDGGWVCGFNGTNTYLLGGNVGVGLRAPTVKLHVDGGVLATKVYLYKPNAANDTGAVYLEYDSTKLGIHLVGAGIYTDTYVSALGVGSGGSGSSGTLHNLDDVDIDDDTLHSGQILVYRNTHWVNENMPSIGGGTVTSVSMSVPTGFAISGSPITGSGTLALAFASGYSLPTTAKQTNWDSAYTFTNGFSSTTINTALGFTLSGTAGETYDLNDFLTGINASMINTALGFTLSGTAGETYDLNDFLTGINASMINTALGFTLSGTAGETYDLDDIGTLANYFTNGIADYAARLTTVYKQAWGQTYWTSNGVPQDVSGDLDDVNDIYMDGEAYPTIFIGKDRSYYLKKTTSSGEDFLAVAVNGEKFNFKETMFYSAVEIRTSVGVYSSGYVTALSDIRHKDVCGTPKLTVEDIAQTQPILFTWKDKQKDQSVQAGVIAQEWQKILPEVVRENDSVLSLDYGVAALISSMIIAKRVVNHEQRLQRIEKELFTN